MNLNPLPTATLALAVSVCAVAQTPAIDEGVLRVKNGFQVYGAAFSAGYSGLSSSELLKSENYSSVLSSISLGFSHTGPKNNLSVTYVPSFSGTFHTSNLQSFNQAMSLEFTRRLTSKWTWYTAGSADDSTIEQFL